MKTMMRTGAALVAMFCSGAAFAGGEGWVSDFAAAKEQAASSNKDLLVDFTGSDWCGWCIKLNKEVFSHDPFKEGVKDKFVLVELDYPKDKSKLSQATIDQNKELGAKYAVKGYPTILLCDASGKPFAATGYQAGGPEKYVEHLDTLRKNKAIRDEALAEASKAEGVAKAKALVGALGAMDLDDTMVANFYGDVIEQIKAADPADETGFAKAIATKQRLATFQRELGEVARKGDFDAASALVDKTLAEGGFGTEDTQQMMVTRATIFAQQKKFDEALKAADEAKAFAPDTKLGNAIDSFKKRIEDAKAKAVQPAEPAEPGTVPAEKLREGDSKKAGEVKSDT